MTSKNLELGTEILRQLIKFDTTNPPGNEAACITYIDNLLKDEGFEPTIIGKTKNRPNLIVRLAGKGQAPPLLLYGHVDVVPTTNQDWTYPPFSAKVVDGSIWGRGALDMKGGVAMMLTALINLKRANFQPTGDIILAVLSDEEAGGELGAEFLVQHHQDIFKNVKFAIGEFGGFPVYMGRKKFYAIQVAEKQICWLKGSIKGPGGHASFPIKD
ncbi:MAG: M20/M25/M40 family metallo-hydrolase, partial [Bacteroidota bacterium]